MTKDITKGVLFKFEVGPFLFEKKLYPPTVERFNKWYNIVKQRPWFKEFEIILCGSFVNTLTTNIPVKTWDVDIILTSNHKEEDNLKIRNILREIAYTALHTCDFFVDTYYQDKKNFNDTETDWQKTREHIKRE